MDPNTNLEEQRRIAARLLADRQRSTHSREVDAVQDAIRLAELVQALDEWITRGGFLPSEWSKPR